MVAEENDKTFDKKNNNKQTTLRRNSGWWKDNPYLFQRSFMSIIVDIYIFRSGSLSACNRRYSMSVSKYFQISKTFKVFQQQQNVFLWWAFNQLPLLETRQWKSKTCLLGSSLQQYPSVSLSVHSNYVLTKTWLPCWPPLKNYWFARCWTDSSKTGWHIFFFFAFLRLSPFPSFVIDLKSLRTYPNILRSQTLPTICIMQKHTRNKNRTCTYRIRAGKLKFYN